MSETYSPHTYHCEYGTHYLNTIPFPPGFYPCDHQRIHSWCISGAVGGGEHWNCWVYINGFFFFWLCLLALQCLVTVTPQCILFSEMVKKDSYKKLEIGDTPLRCPFPFLFLTLGFFPCARGRFSSCAYPRESSARASSHYPLCEDMYHLYMH